MNASLHGNHITNNPINLILTLVNANPRIELPPPMPTLHIHNANSIFNLSHAPIHDTMHIPAVDKMQRDALNLDILHLAQGLAAPLTSPGCPRLSALHHRAHVLGHRLRRVPAIICPGAKLRLQLLQPRAQRRDIDGAGVGD